MRAHCRRCDAAVDAAGAWPGACLACGTPVEAHPVPDVVRPGLRALLVGIDPGIQTARARLHFANPRNAFWGALHASGLTPRRVAPHEQASLLDLGLGISNVVTRATPGSAVVTPEDVARGRARLQGVVGELRPAWLAFVGKEAYRMASGGRAAGHGEAPPGRARLRPSVHEPAERAPHGGREGRVVPRAGAAAVAFSSRTSPRSTSPSRGSPAPSWRGGSSPASRRPSSRTRS